MQKRSSSRPKLELQKHSAFKIMICLLDGRVEDVVLAFPLGSSRNMVLVILLDLLFRPQPVIHGHRIILPRNSASANRRRGVCVLDVLIDVGVQRDTAIVVWNRLWVDARSVRIGGSVGGWDAITVLLLLAALLAVVDEWGVVVEEAEQHGATLLFGKHEVERGDAAPEGQGEAFAVRPSCQHSDL